MAPENKTIWVCVGGECSAGVCLSGSGPSEELAWKTIPSREGDIYFLLLCFSALLENIAEISILKSGSIHAVIGAEDVMTNLSWYFLLKTN